MLAGPAAAASLLACWPQEIARTRAFIVPGVTGRGATRRVGGWLRSAETSIRRGVSSATAVGLCLCRPVLLARPVPFARRAALDLQDALEGRGALKRLENGNTDPEYRISVPEFVEA